MSAIIRLFTPLRLSGFGIAQSPQRSYAQAARRDMAYRRGPSRASLSDVAPGATCSEVVGCCWPMPSCGKLALKFLYRSSLGFCDVLLRAASADVVAARTRHRGASRSVWPWRLCSGSQRTRGGGQGGSRRRTCSGTWPLTRCLVWQSKSFQHYRSMEEAASVAVDVVRQLLLAWRTHGGRMQR